MTAKEVAALDKRLDRFLADVTASLGRSERHRWAKVYLPGLLMEGDRKSIEPLANRIDGADVQSLRQQEPTGAGVGGSSVGVGRAPAAGGGGFGLRQ